MLILSVVCVTLSGQTVSINDVSNWLESGQYERIGQLLADDVNSTIDGRSMTGRKAAAPALASLFKDKKVDDYRLVHSGNNGSSTFLIAGMTIDDQPKRINILIKEGEIVELRIE